MKIIQSFNTFGGFRFCCGMQSPRALKAHFEKAYLIHRELGSSYTLYTDKYGADFLSDIVAPEHIEIFDFPIEYDDKLLYIGKFQVQEIQTEPYLHIDMDDLAESLPVGVSSEDVIIHRYRKPKFSRVTAELGMDYRYVDKMPCSNMIGFNDMDFQKLYIQTARKWIDKAAKQPIIPREHAIIAEEAVLQDLVFKHKKTVSTIV